VVAPESGNTPPITPGETPAKYQQRIATVNNNITQHLHVQGGDLKSVAKAAGQGPATETEKAMHNALASQGGS